MAEATKNQLQLTIKDLFTPVQSLADLELPLTTNDAIERIEQSLGYDVDRYELVTELNDLGFVKTMVGNEWFWLMK